VHLLFSANKVEGGIVYDDYLVDESVSDVTGVLGSYGINGATDTYYIEVFDVGAGTVIKGFSAKDIMMGVDDRNGNALLYIDTGIGVRKYLSDGSISEIETLYAGGGGGGSDTQSYMTDKDGDPVPDKQDNNIEIK